MDTNHISAGKPLWISHRGYHNRAVENTVEAFRAAVDRGFTAFETDLRITHDGHIVLYHDPTLERLANDPRRVSELSRPQLEKMHFVGGGRPFFLDELIQEFAGYRWAFDLKPEKGPQTIRAMMDWARGGRLEPWLVEHVKFLAWHRDHERLLKQLLPEAVCYARKMECWRANLAVLIGWPGLGGIQPSRTYAIPPRLFGIPLFRKAIVESFHRDQGRVVAFLPETEDDAGKAVRIGFEEILTDGGIVDAGPG
jgi:glycerophosphoryl diester phosphodiesterase